MYRFNLFIADKSILTSIAKNLNNDIPKIPITINESICSTAVETSYIENSGNGYATHSSLFRKRLCYFIQK